MTSARRKRGRAADDAWRIAAALPLAGMLSIAAPRAAVAGSDWLRGSVDTGSYMRWDGLNFGAQFGLTSMNTNFGGSTGTEIAYILRNTTLENEAAPSSWTTLSSSDTSGQNYGVFFGYNYQMEQLVLGFDATYNRTTNLRSAASDSMTRIVTTSDGVTHTVTISAQSSNELIDYATLRFKAGYAFGQFLPYVFIGGAAGRFNYTSSATVSDHQVQGATVIDFGPETQSNNKNNAVVGGFTGGLGIDVAVLPNVFLRGEWEFVGFTAVNGIRSMINSGKVGIGVKF